MGNSFDRLITVKELVKLSGSVPKICSRCRSGPTGHCVGGGAR